MVIMIKRCYATRADFSLIGKVEVQLRQMTSSVRQENLIETKNRFSKDKNSFYLFHVFITFFVRNLLHIAALVPRKAEIDSDTKVNYQTPLPTKLRESKP